MRIFVFLVFMFLVACNDNCVTESTRCNGEVIEICNSSGKWEESMDCSVLSEGLPFGFECGEDTDGEHACLMVGGIDASDLDAGW